MQVSTYMIKMKAMRKETKTHSTRHKIVSAALKIFSRRGYRGATTRAIAKEAGVNEVTLFRHFGNKQKLFAEVIGNYSAIPYIEAARGARDRSLEERLWELADNVMRILHKRRNLIALLLSEGPRQSKQAKAILEAGPAQVIARLTRWFQEAQEAGEIREIDPQCAARALVGMFFFYEVFQKILPGEKVLPVNPELVRKTFIEILLRGILPGEKTS